jgi:hypothetical protein
MLRLAKVRRLCPVGHRLMLEQILLALRLDSRCNRVGVGLLSQSSILARRGDDLVEVRDLERVRRLRFRRRKDLVDVLDVGRFQ